MFRVAGEDISHTDGWSEGSGCIEHTILFAGALANRISLESDVVEKKAHHKLLQARLEKFIMDPNSTWMLRWRQRILHHVFNIAVDINLLQRDSHRAGFGICEHDEFDVCRSFIVVELVLGGSIGQKTAPE